MVGIGLNPPNYGIDKTHGHAGERDPHKKPMNGGSGA